MRREASPEFRDLASRLLSLEAGEDGTPEGLAEGLQRALRKLHARMSRLLTAPGFEAILQRGLRLAVAGYPFLRAAQIQPEADGGIKGLRESVESLSPAEAREVLEALLANTFDMLSTFIGEDLTMRQLYRAWPEISPGETLFKPQEARE